MRNTILKRITTCIFFAITVYTATILLSSSNVSKENMPYSQIPYCAVSPKLPASITFAGEKIDLTSQEHRERMDREILAFTYSHINTMLQIKRANRLFPIIEPILKECGIPDDFKYLMIIESNGDIYARSGVGAGGLWQFMEGTGKQYGLEVNNFVDERYHIEKATRAACRYLRKMYGLFDNWMTVAASYNAGETSIAKRVEAQKEKDGMNLSLVPETSRYLFRLLTAKTIFSDPVAYGFLLHSHDLYPPLPIAKKITIKGNVDNWADIAKKHGLTYLQLREANPWIRSTKMPNKTGKSYTVLIPDAKALHYNPQKTKAHNPKWVIK
ncbi:MAG: lytic transglycosylase domain-containing protein [Bacteroidaceae bacterium]|nr:lytic transglycosylase domain-containing protein [Bacteroidaceae bacterium]